MDVRLWYEETKKRKEESDEKAAAEQAAKGDAEKANEDVCRKDQLVTRSEEAAHARPMLALVDGGLI